MCAGFVIIAEIIFEQSAQMIVIEYNHMRRKHQLTRNRVQFQNRLECLLEEAHIKLSSLVSDLLGKSARRMLQAIAEDATSPEAIAGLADQRLRATAHQLCDALGACRDLHPSIGSF